MTQLPDSNPAIFLLSKGLVHKCCVPGAEYIHLTGDILPASAKDQTLD